ncbi:hypothetical protein [Desulfobacter vibrioformis]|uniref:hypothetical protein n=1 Tax=Desulfobacter vibrioformis TaxID=34031 RepID=UPI0005547F9A|nr:hypothetical protein [Desulfobacter vibrioformis]
MNALKVTGSDIVQDIASSGAAYALDALFEGAEVPLDGIGSDVSGLIMSLLFKGGGNPDNKILKDLDQIQSTLETIETQLGVFEKQLEALKEQMAIDTSDIENNNEKVALNKYIDTIDYSWECFYGLRIQNKDGSWSWTSDLNSLKTLADSILGKDSNAQNIPSPDSVRYPLFCIHNGLTGEGDTEGNLFQDIANNAVLHVDAGGDRLGYFYVMENYFGKMLHVQTKAATLIVEAHRYRDESDSGKDETVNDATIFMEWYRSHIEDQVECFLKSVEYYIVNTARLYKGFAEFIPNADTMFRRADLSAAWLSRRHRPNPDHGADGQHMVAYRAIGGPQRLSQYPDQWKDSVQKADWNRMLYKKTGESDSFDVPKYTNAKVHDNKSTATYVQYHYDKERQDCLSDAKTIAVTKFFTSDFTTARKVGVDFYLHDFPYRPGAETQVAWVNAKGNPPEDGEKSILYGHILDIQQLWALAWGKWDVSHSHNSHHGLDSMEHSCKGASPHDSRDLDGWNSLEVCAYPSTTTDFMSEYGVKVSGHFFEENANVGHFTWVGSSKVSLKAHYSAAIKGDWEMKHKAYPGNHEWGLYVWLQSSEGHDSKDFTRSITKDLKSASDKSLEISIPPNHSFYISIGSRMKGNWEDIECTDGNWHHWHGKLTTHVKDLFFVVK